MKFTFKKMIVSVNFFLRGKEASSNEKPCVVYATVDVDGKKSVPFSTKLKVPPLYWMTNGDKRRKIERSSDLHPVSSSYSFSSQINENLTAIRKFVSEAKVVLEALDLAVSPETIKQLILNPRPIRPVKKIIDVVDELRADLESKGREEATLLTYRTRRNNFETFLIENSLLKLTVDQFRFHHFSDFQNWMANKKNEDLKFRWRKNTINKHLTMVNKALKFAVNMEYIKANPVGTMGLEYDPTSPPCYLEAEARQRIFSCEFKTLEVERDIAVFLYNTGLSYTDYASLSDEHLMRLPSGQWFIKKARDKSDVYSLIPLLKQAHEIITKYGSISAMPRPDISDLNKTLKILGEACKSPFSLSTSVFRETFSSMMENEYMIPDRLLMFMMGHTNPRQLNNYSAVMPARILHELNKNDITIPFNIESFKELVKAS